MIPLKKPLYLKCPSKSILAAIRIPHYPNTSHFHSVYRKGVSERLSLKFIFRMDEDEDLQLNYSFGDTNAASTSQSKSSVTRQKKSLSETIPASSGVNIPAVKSTAVKGSKRKPLRQVPTEEPVVRVVKKKKITTEPLLEPRVSPAPHTKQDSPAAELQAFIKPEMKRKHMQLSRAEDPNQYHAKPRDLDESALKKLPMELDKSSITQHIFSRLAFSELPLHPRLSRQLEKSVEEKGLGLTTSTRVQSVVLPLLCPSSAGASSASLLMKSQTGSGKTLAYLLPVLHSLMNTRRIEDSNKESTTSGGISRQQGTQALIIAPTRELSMQIGDTLSLLTRACAWVVTGTVSGGEKRKSEKARLRKGVTVLVGTPGRLLDHARSTESFKLNSLKWVVLDEADRCLDYTEIP